MQMTDLLKHLLHAYGLLYITIEELQQSRPGTSHASLKAYYDSLGPGLPGEPSLMVRVSNDRETRIVPKFTGPGVPDSLRDADVTLMELPEDEFHFFQAFRPGMFDLQKEVPAFILEMSLIHAYALFEAYVSDVVRLRLKAHPAQIGMDKHVSLAEVLASADKNALLDAFVERELNQIMHEPIGATLKRLRERLGLRSLAEECDLSIVKLSLVRNCLIHNKGISDKKLVAADPAVPLVTKIIINGDDVRAAIATCRHAAVAVDASLLRL